MERLESINQSIPLRGNTFVTRSNLILQMREAHSPTTAACLSSGLAGHTRVLVRRIPSVYAVAVLGRASQAPDPSLRVRPFVPPCS